jgi:hypothetical protein
VLGREYCSPKRSFLRIEHRRNYQGYKRNNQL